MPSRTQMICLHEGEKGRSIDPVFIRALLKALAPAWMRHWEGNNVIETKGCGGRKRLIEQLPGELRSCLARRAHTTLMVWADLDHDMPNGDALKESFWVAAKQAGIGKEDFDRVVFIFAKDRLENWIEFLLGGTTDESKEGARQKHGRAVAEAARTLARRCQTGADSKDFPPSLTWSCQNWRKRVKKLNT